MSKCLKSFFVGALALSFLLSTFALPSQTQAQSREELLALIQVLIARVAELQAQIAARTSVSTYGYNFTRDLTLGSTGQDVTALQQFLVNKGYMTTPSGYGTFGPATQNALASYQRARRITPVAGFFGPTTRAIVTQESKSIAFNFGTSGGSSSGTIAYTNPTQYGTGGSGNAPIVPRRTGGGGGGGGRSSSSSSNNNNNPPTDNNNQPPGAECSDGVDNDNDGFTDFPIDPGCAIGGTEGSSSPDAKTTYAYKHWPISSSSYCSGSGTTFTCTPPSNFHNVIYPLVLDIRNSSLNPYVAKAYTDALPEGGRGMFSWVMDSGNDSQGNFFRDADNCVDGSGNTVTYTYTGINPMIVTNAGGTVSNGGQAPYRCPWMDDWYSVVHTRWENFFRDYAAIGGKVDVVTVDNEVSSHISQVDWPKLNAIVTSPKFSQSNNTYSSGSLARGSMQSKMGNNLANLASNQTNCENASGNGCVISLYNFLDDWFYSYLNEATYVPLHTYFPNAALSNFNSLYYDHDHYYAPIFAHPDVTSCPSGGLYCSNGLILGTHQQPGLMYGSNVARSNVFFDGVRPYSDTPFNKIKQEVDWIKVSRLSNPDSKMAPLYAGSRYTQSMPAGSYAESIFHALLAGSDFLQQWHDAPVIVAEEQKLSLAMDEFDEIAGFADKETLMFEDDELNERLTVEDRSAWGDDYILTGMKTGGRHVWRFTPETGRAPQISTITDTIVSSDPLVFQTAQYTITFPQGKIYTPSNSQSPQGYWIVQPLGAYPVISNESDINISPIANFVVWNINSGGSNYVIFDSIASLDPDGPTITRSYDFNGDGTYGDPVRFFDGNTCPFDNCGSNFGPHFFNYRFESAGPHTVGLKVTDSEGASTEYRKTFTIPSAVCNGRHFECPITLSAAENPGSNIAQAINAFWRGTASLIFGFFAALISFFIP